MIRTLWKRFLFTAVQNTLLPQWKPHKRKLSSLPTTQSGAVNLAALSIYIPLRSADPAVSGSNDITQLKTPETQYAPPPPSVSNIFALHHRVYYAIIRLSQGGAPNREIQRGGITRCAISLHSSVTSPRCASGSRAFAANLT